MSDKLKQTYYYDKQIRRYILQFMAVFSVFKVMVGKTDTRGERLISIPIHYASMDRITAAIVANNTQNKPIRVPAMSAYLRDFKLSPSRRHGTGVERRNVYTPVGGLVPDDMKVIHQRMPVPYDLEMELAIYSSNIDQHMQILEQILPLFDPQLNIQTSDAPFDWTRLTSLELTGIMSDDLLSNQLEDRVIQTTLTFNMPIWLDFPANIKDDFVAKIFTRVGMVSSDTSFEDDAAVIQELNDAGYVYNKMFDADDLPFD